MSQVLSAYSAMSATEFDAINARQDWANWRTIPRAMNGHLPNHPLRVLDLGCGTGSSTRVLAYYCPVGSHITGFEIAALVGGEFFIHGLDSLGFNFETGVGITNVKKVRFRTLGDHIFRAGMFFYF